ncbi:MAG: integral rane sensor signal transduction histidine kinase [Rhodospirillales bacterium]|nr:integral rane sensor signal transduction histidine kinase [Rhodospirillales bacterium]
MLRIYGCIADQHDLRLVALAGAICLLSCYTALSVFARACVIETRRRWGWLAVTPVVFGGGVWATHFVAMLAFLPGVAVGYDLTVTGFSIIVAIAISALGFAIALPGRRDSPIGGALVGLAIAAMHYTGVHAMRLPAVAVWDSGLVVASLAAAVVFGALGFWVFSQRTALRYRLSGAALLTIAICGMHFTGMAAVSFRLDPTIVVSDEVLAPEFLAVAIAAVTVLIVALGLAGSIFDQHLAQRAVDETERLHSHIAELERTKADLETITTDLQTALDAAAAASQAKSSFLATMSHELRTPLNAVIGFSEIIAAQPFGPLGDERYRDYAATINESGMHLLALINDVLDFSKIDVGRLQLDEEEIDVVAAIAGAVRLIRGNAADGDIRLLEEPDASLPPLRADARRLRQVLLNLLSNAVKFTPAGGQVRISAHRRDGDLVISVADTGIGIAAEDIPKALERFGQIDNRLNRKFEGTGLGLPLSKRLMELHDGTLELASVLGAGTTVTMVFPASRCQELAEADA